MLGTESDRRREGQSLAVEWRPTDSPRDRSGGPPDDDLLGSLRASDEAAFLTLVHRITPSLVRLARLYVPDQAQAEDVAQEAWLGLLRGLDRFEGRSSLRTWLFHILTNIAKTRGRREARSISFSALWDASAEPNEPAVDPDAFLPADHPEWPGHWRAMLPSWSELPESRLLSRETRAAGPSDRRAAAQPTRGHHAARRGGLDRRRGV